MRFAFTDDQLELKRNLRRVLDARADAETLRRLVQADAGIDRDLWAMLAGELGLAGLIVPEEHDGVGLGWVELVAVTEELGRSLAMVPFFSTVCLTTTAVLVAGDDEQQRAILPGIAVGETTGALADLESGGHLGPDGITATATPAGDEVVLAGDKRYVIDGHTADFLIVAARSPASRGREAVGLYVVPAETAGVHRERLPTMDPTRSLARVTLDDVRVPAAARLSNGGWAELETVRALAAVALAGEQVGGAQHCLDSSVEYAGVREQFGRPIGSFQAVQHHLAEMFLEVESARSAAYYAGWAAAHEPDELAAAAATAAAYCGDAYYHVAGQAIQVHGGVGFTWEHHAHLHFKRARADRDLLGTPALHREWVAARLLDDGVVV